MSNIWYAVFETGTTGANSNPISIGTVIDEAHLTTQGRTYITLPSDPTGMVWQQSTQTFVAPPAPPIVLSTVDFMTLFTLQERIALRTSADPIIQDFIWHVNIAQTITLNNPLVLNGLAYISANPSGAPILAAGRSTAIEAGTPSGS